MSTHLTDEQLLDVLARAIAEADPVPVELVAAAKAAYTWRTIDSELAELVFDSAVEELVGIRSAETARQVTFRAPGVEIEIMVMSEETRRLVGQLVPPQQATVELRMGSEVREAGTDTLGRFTFAEVPTGPVQLAVSTGEGGTIVTEWMVV